jgi:prolyl-tRNA synthetase
MAAEIVMVPFSEDDPLVDGDGDETCAICGEDAERTAYFAKSY